MALDLAKNVSKLKKTDKAAFYYPFDAKAMRAPIDSEASMHMLNKKELSWDEMETLRRSKNSTTLVTASGEVQTNVEAHENVHDLDLFVTGSLREDVCLQFYQLCEEHGEQSRLTKQGNKLCKTEDFVPLVVLDCRQTLVRIHPRYHRTHQVHFQV